MEVPVRRHIFGISAALITSMLPTLVYADSETPPALIASADGTREIVKIVTVRQVPVPLATPCSVTTTRATNFQGHSVVIETTDCPSD